MNNIGHAHKGVHNYNSVHYRIISKYCLMVICSYQVPLIIYLVIISIVRLDGSMTNPTMLLIR